MSALDCSLSSLRRLAVGRSLFAARGLQEAIDRMGFVQADPIRAPARAQDLILRQRVAEYRAGDLERLYPEMEVEEDFLYAYGFLSRAVWQLARGRRDGELDTAEELALEAARALGEARPKELGGRLGAERVVNAWGGFSKAATVALERLHGRGYLRVARRENGVRVYAPVDTDLVAMTDGERLLGLIWAHVEVFAPCPLRSLLKELSRYRALGDGRAAVVRLVAAGALRQEAVAGLEYVYPASAVAAEEGAARARLLAPFDPLVWDRRRFEHFWGWAYRFEAYTPPAKRVRGYYALPLLWGLEVIGWANVKVEKGELSLDLGFVGRRPRSVAFREALDAEVASLRRFLGLDAGG